MRGIIIKLNFLSSVVFQWTISYMISPDAANLGVKAVYVWAGLLVPTTALLWIFYPEVRRRETSYGCCVHD